jgi:predicted AlkP superfamily phosphohydrolase/phosphomutase
MKNQKAMLLGIDGAIPTLIHKFVAEGNMPHLKRCMDTGAYSDMLSVIPVATPINWASITTGALPGTHKVTGFWSHKPGTRIDQYESTNAFCNTYVGAERIWEAAERCGKKCVLLKFPGSWPSSLKRGKQVDGYCIPAHGNSVVDLAPNGCHSNLPLHKAEKITLLPARGWVNVPSEYRLLMEADIRIALKRGFGSIRYNMLVCGVNEYDTVLLCKNKDAAESVATLHKNDWSGWLTENVDAETRATVRFKLSDLAGDGSAVKLYHAQIYPTNGFTQPESLSEELVGHCGPMLEFATPHAWKYGWVDFDTCYEEALYQVEWMRKAAEKLLADPWDLFITQMHWIDHVQHYFLPYVEPVSPLYDPVKATVAWERLRQAYRLADDFIGHLVGLADNDTAVFVLSDHGNVCDEYTLSLLPLFVKEGLIATKKDERGGIAVDWSKTLAYPCKPGNGEVFVNLKGRDEEGCVPESEYESVRERVVKMRSDRGTEREKSVQPRAAQRGRGDVGIVRRGLRRYHCHLYPRDILGGAWRRGMGPGGCRFCARYGRRL